MKISSFNCSGFKGNCDYISEVYGKCDILLLQETWLYNFEFNLFNKKIPTCQYHATSAMDESNIGRVGRPFGGCAIIWNKNLALSIIPVDTTSPRLCAVVIKSENLNIIMCNVYMPCDDNTDEHFEIYGDILYELTNLFDLYRGYDIIIGGDFNVDFSRMYSRNLNIVRQFINDEQLTCVSQRCSKDEYTYQKGRFRSFIDHFLVSERLNNCNFYISHDGDNFSDHEPINIKTTCITSIIPENTISWQKIEWDKTNDEHIANYKNLLDDNFRHLTISETVMNCNDFNCRQHDDYILQKLNESIDIFKFCANATIPNKRYSSKKGIHGWNEFVKPFKEKSIFWHNIWKSAGSPVSGPLTNMRRFTRSKYHWAVKKAKQDTNSLIINETAQQLASKSFREFWGTIKRLKGTNKVTSNVVDGICNDQGIADNFQNIYNNLYNSVSDTNFVNVVEEVNNLVTNKCNNNNNNNSCTSAHCHGINKSLLYTESYT